MVDGPQRLKRVFLSSPFPTTTIEMPSSSPAWPAESLVRDGGSPNSLWTEEDEVGLLKSALEIAREPAESYNPAISLFYRLRRTLKGSYTNAELVAKIDELRRRYDDDNRRKMLTGGAANAAVFEISKQIWGAGAVPGTVQCYTRKRKRGSKEKAAPFIPFPKESSLDL